MLNFPKYSQEENSTQQSFPKCLNWTKNIFNMMEIHFKRNALFKNSMDYMMYHSSNNSKEKKKQHKIFTRISHLPIIAHIHSHNPILLLLYSQNASELSLHCDVLLLLTSILLLNRLVLSDSLWPHGLWLSQSLLCLKFFQARSLKWVAISYSLGLP